MSIQSYCFIYLVSTSIRGTFNNQTGIQDGAFSKKKLLTIFTKTSILSVWQGSNKLLIILIVYLKLHTHKNTQTDISNKI